MADAPDYAELTRLDTPSAVDVLNDNFRKTAESIETLVADSQGVLRGDLDANSKRIINLPDAILPSQAVPYGQMLAERLQGIPGKDGKDGEDGAPGLPGKDGVNGAAGSSAGLAALFVTANGMTIGSGVTVLATAGYSAPGDGGDAYYELVGSTEPAVPASAKFKDAANRWWRYVVRGPVRIEQFGGRCDCPFAVYEYAFPFTSSYPMPAAGGYTDNLQPLYDAIRTVNVDANVLGRNEVGSMIPIEFIRNIDTAKCYGFSGQIIPQYACYIRGTFAGGDSIKSGTTFRFPPNSGGILYNHAETQPAGYVQKGAGFSILEGIWFQGGGGTDRSAHGLRLRVAIRVFRCTFDSFPGNNIHNVGSVGLPRNDDRFGITSSTSMYDVTCRAAGGWNTYTEGSDVSASLFVNLQHKGSRLGGLFDSGSFANTYSNYGNHGHGMGRLGACKYNGRRFALISPTPGVGGTTQPGTNDLVWEDRGPHDNSDNPFFPAWVSGGDYQLSLPSWVAFPGTTVDCYIENYYLPQVGGMLTGTSFPSRYANAMGGSDQPGGLEIIMTRNFGLRYSVPPSAPDFAVVGDFIERRIGGGVNSPSIIDAWRTSKTPSGWSLQYSFNGQRMRYGMGGVGSGNPMAYELLTDASNDTLGRPTPARGFIVMSNFAIGNENGAGTARIHFTFDGPPGGKYFDSTGTQQNRARGEVLWNSAPSKGGALIYTAMGDGTVEPVGIVGAVRATGLNASSTAAQIVQALKDAGLAS